MFSVQFNVGESRNALRKAMAALTDMTPIYQDIAEYMVDATRQRFIRGEAPNGSKWPAKSQTTLDRYKALGYGALNKPLIGPGRRLSSEIQGFVSAGGVVIGSSLIYSGVMQDGAAKGAFGRTARGAPIPWGRIPARTWLGISKDDDAAIVRIADVLMAKALDAKG